MDHSKILIVGANGQLGRALKQSYPNAKAYTSSELDITNMPSLSKIGWKEVDIIINAAAYTNVDNSETIDGRKLAWKVNAEGTRNLVSIALRNDLLVVGISTDYVFDGTIKSHLETEDFSPINVYGQTKAVGDIAYSLLANYYIIRTSWVIGDGKNFVKTMIDLGKRNIQPKVIADQIGRLTFTDELVKAINHLLITKPGSGIYNVSNSGQISSWADITRQIFKLCKYNLNVYDTSSNDYFKDKPMSAKRPLYSVLDLTKIHSTGFNSTNWLIDLKAYINKEGLN